MNTVIIIIAGVLIVLVLYGIGVYNKLVNAKNKVANQFSQVDIQLKRRADLIPNLVETVKGYAKHEEGTLTAVIEARNKAVKAGSVNEKIEANNELTGALNKLFALAEAYPELKANENFIDLSNKLTKIEDDIANARKYYNGTVRIYNNKVQMFPNNIFAKIFNYKTKRMFEASLEDKQNIRINL